MRSKILLLSAILTLTLSGCGTRTIVIQPGETLVVEKPIPGARLLVPDENGNLVGRSVDIPAGALVKTPGGANAPTGK